MCRQNIVTCACVWYFVTQNRKKRKRGNAVNNMLRRKEK